MNVRFSEDVASAENRKTPNRSSKSDDRVSVRYTDPSKYVDLALPIHNPEEKYQNLNDKLIKFKIFPKISAAFFVLQVLAIIVSAFAVIDYYITGVKECKNNNEKRCNLAYGWIFLVYFGFLFVNAFWLWILYVGISSFQKRKATDMGLVAVSWGASTLLNFLVIFLPPLVYWVAMVIPTSIWFYMTLRLHLILQEFELLKPYLYLAGRTFSFLN